MQSINIGLTDNFYLLNFQQLLLNLFRKIHDL